MRVLRVLVLASLLFSFWLLLSGFFTPFLVGAGLVCSLAVALLAARMGLLQPEGSGMRMGPAALGYLIWLLAEIVKSSWQVTRIILHPSLPIRPTLIRFRPLQQTPLGLVIHAQSITLTPGTYTVEAQPGEFLVHGLTAEGANNDVDSETDRRVRALEQAR